MGKKRMHIVAVRNGVSVGYIKSVSYTKRKFKVTQNEAEAKGYTREEVIQDEIDFLTEISPPNEFVFVYDIFM